MDIYQYTREAGSLIFGTIDSENVCRYRLFGNLHRQPLMGSFESILKHSVNLRSFHLKLIY